MDQADPEVVRLREDWREAIRRLSALSLLPGSLWALGPHSFLCGQTEMGAPR